MEFREAKITDTNSSGKRAVVDTSECGICEPCAPSKMPKLGQSSQGASSSAAAEGDNMAVMTFDQFLCLPCDVDEPAGSGMRAVGTIEGAVGEPCALKRSKKPKLGQSSKGASSSAAAEGDTVDANPMPKGSRFCIIDGCGKHSSYGPIGGATNSAFLCSGHGKKHGGCENVNKKTCEVHMCKHVPTFGPAGGLRKSATCCAGHGKLKGYVDLVHPRCEHANCVTIASFGPRGTKRARCGHHQKDGDFNLTYKKCEHEDCDEYAYYGPRDGKGARCYTHREAGDVDLRNYLCEGTNCDKYAIYGIEGGQPQYCVLHFDPDKHIDVKNPRCNKCTMRPLKYPHPDSLIGQCIECDPAVFGPRMKQKEEEAKAELEEAFGETNPAMREAPVDFCGEGADRTACGKNQSIRARVDFVLQSADKVVVVEVDEDAHRHYCQPSDIARMNDIYAAYLTGGNLNHRHVHFVRFNPDTFKIGGEEAKVSMKIRYATLIKVVRAALASSSSEDNRPWSMRHLFYDCDANGRLCIMDEISEHIRPMVDAPIYGGGV